MYVHKRTNVQFVRLDKGQRKLKQIFLGKILPVLDTAACEQRPEPLRPATENYLPVHALGHFFLFIYLSIPLHASHGQHVFLGEKLKIRVTMYYVQ